MRAAILLAAAGAAAAAPGDADVQLIRNPLPPTFCDPTAAGEAGYLNISSPTTGNKAYFYQAWSSRNDPTTDPVTLWLTGGPGCSSMLALYTENGPCQANADGSGTLWSTYSWTQNSTVIFLDQPAGAGFSTGDTDTNSNQTSDDIWDFLQAYMSAHPEQQAVPFYIFGESYGGHYVPAASYEIFTRNQNLQPGEIAINFKGFGVGNGLTEPQVQYQFYGQMAYNYSIQKLGYPVLPLATYKTMQKALPSCISQIAACQTDSSVCASAMSSCNAALVEPYEQTGLSPYDMRKPCSIPPLCVDMGPVTTLLNDATVQETLGVTGIEWAPCNFDVNGGFGSDWMVNYGSTRVPEMLNAGITAVIYAGDVGFICNWLGNQAWTLGLQWSGQSAFNAAPMLPWAWNGTAAGEVRNYGPLTFARVYNAGHMAPADQPGPMQDLFTSFVHGLPITA